MKRAIVAAVLSAFICCAACATEPTEDERFLESLNRGHVELSFAGEVSDSTTIEYGKNVCDLVRRKGPSYNPVPVIQLDHDLSEEKARIVYTAAMENYCPALIR